MATPVYIMNGMMLILNYAFHGDEEKRRLGSDKDVAVLRSLFTDFGFNVSVNEDLGMF